MATSLVCPNCNTSNRLGAKFCVKCGTDLTTFDPTRQSSPIAGKSVSPPTSSATPVKAKTGGLLDWLFKSGQQAAVATGTGPLTVKAKRAHPDQLTGGYLSLNAIYQRMGDIAQHTTYFVARDAQGQYVLAREVDVPSLCDAGNVKALVTLAKELKFALPLIDIICTPDNRTYLILKHPDQRFFFLSDVHDPYASDRVIEWGLQIGTTLDTLHRRGYALGEQAQTGLEKIVIEGPEAADKSGTVDLSRAQARFADLSTCVSFPPDEAQKRRSILDDIFFVTRALYWMATSRNLSKDVQVAERITGLPRPLRVAITLGARSHYVSMQEMLAHLSGQNLPPLRLVSGKATHPGRVRDHNEDQYFVYEVSKGRSDQPLPAFYMVADGIGGQEAGEVASDTISAALKDWLDEYSNRKAGRATQRLGELPDGALRTAIQTASEKVFNQAQQRQNNMGATVTAALVMGDTAYVANVGDSRTYLFRDGRLKRITNDHSLVFSLASAGQIGWDDIYTHPQRNKIYRSLGEKPTVEVDIFKVGLDSGDMLLLCSDGLWEMVRDPEMAAILGSARTTQEASDRLIDAANRGGGEDNITAIVVKVG